MKKFSAYYGLFKSYSLLDIFQSAALSKNKRGMEFDYRSLFAHLNGDTIFSINRENIPVQNQIFSQLESQLSEIDESAENYL